MDPAADLPLGSPYTDSHYGWPAGTSLLARCSKFDHSAPAPGCSCGVRVAPSAAHTARGLLAEWRLGDEWTALGRQPRFDRIAIGACAVFGVQRASRRIGWDYSGYVRADGAEIKPYSTLVLPRTLAHAAPRLREVYGIDP